MALAPLLLRLSISPPGADLILGLERSSTPPWDILAKVLAVHASELSAISQDES